MTHERSRDLVVVTAEPFNAETRLDQQFGLITPTRRHYVRSHFPDPTWPGRLVVDGAVRHPLTLGLADLEAMRSSTMLVTLECAGNGRAFLDPPCPAEQWGLGAVSTAEWVGVPLADVLRLAEPEDRAVEVRLTGADEGVPKDLGRRISFERSLPIAQARDGEALLAYAMNGERLTADHGAPLRLVVPRAYGVASVKWLARVTALSEPFRGFYQHDRYVIDGAPLGPTAPRAVIVSPAEGTRLRGDGFLVRGYAWSGTAPVAAVAVSDDAGRTWDGAEVGPSRDARAWCEWSLRWRPRGVGEVALLPRATDAAGRVQPLQPVRNEFGYGNNAARPVRVRVEAP